MYLQQTRLIVALLAFAGVAQAQTCKPGQAVDCDPAAKPYLQIKPKSIPKLAGCRVPGRWISSFNAIAVVNADLSGTMKYPYCNSAHTLTITLQGETGFHVDSAWNGGSECIGLTENLTFESCEQATGTYANSDGATGNDTWVRDSHINLAIRPTAPIIPASSRVLDRTILTRSNLRLTLTDTDQPVENASITLQSSRGASDTIKGPANPTDSAGKTRARIETRVQTGPSTITSVDPEITTDPTATITWLPARFESEFLVTCYVISSEADFVTTPLVRNVPGLPAGNAYHRGFIKDVRLQGSGFALDNTYIHYDGGGRYSLQSCALTASGVCAVDGVTAAVDRKVIPLRSTISINAVGSRIAQDTGGAIDDYHIDEYFGTRRAACNQAGHRNLGVEFIKY